MSDNQRFPATRFVTLPLVAALLAPTMAADWRFPTVLLYGVGLFLILVASLSLLRQLSPRVETIVFAAFVILSIIKLLIFEATGLHINFFLLSLIGEFSGREWWIMVQKAVTYLPGVIAISFLILYLVRRLNIHYVQLPAPWLLALGVIFAAMAELTISFFFLTGDPRATALRRDLAFHISPHPYHLRKAADYLGVDAGGNPFATPLATQANDGTSPPPLSLDLPLNPQSIVLLVADSMRSKDLERDTTIAPTMAERESVRLKLRHNAVSNCTHFSFYTMLYGRYPSGFSAARQNRQPAPFITALRKEGYDIQSFEAHSLDWYDTRELTVGDDIPIFKSNKIDFFKADEETVSQAISAIEQNTSQPYFYLVYLYGTHWPYGTERSTTPLQEKYEKAVSHIDSQVGRLISSIDQLPENNRPVLIATSDHGEEIGDQFGHSSRLSEEQLYVPLAVYGLPDGNMPTSHLDLLPFLQNVVSRRPHTAQTGPEIMMQCNYDFPTEFRVRTAVYDISFRMENRILSPLPSMEPSSNNSRYQREAFRLLLEAINN